MYTIRKVSDIHDELVIENSIGEVELRLPVNINIEDVLARYNRLRRLLSEAQEKLRQDPNCDQYQTYYGTIFVEILKIVFGEEGCAKLLANYENKYEKLLSDVAPFIVDAINPKMEAAMKSRAEKYRRLNKAAKPKRRWPLA